jgi:[ribosomal protein S5]-alanine N-acetyltransferase
MPAFPTLETERLILRSLDLKDAPLVYDYMQTRDIAYNTLLIPYPYPVGAAEEWINRTLDNMGNGEDFNFALARKTDGLFMGVIGIGSDPEHKRAEIGYWLGKPHWSQGFMSEALRRVLDFGFDDLDLNRIYAGYFTRNPASRRVMEKAGMTYEGTARQNVLKWGEFVDVGSCSILRSEWESK